MSAGALITVRLILPKLMTPPKAQQMSFTTQGSSNLKSKIRLMVYQTLYNNIRNRLGRCEENLDYDFLTAHHFEASEYLVKYSVLPRVYHCKSNVGFQGMFNAGNTYMVVAGFDTVVLLMEPEAAFARNLPFIAILDGNTFRPYLGCPTKLWQTKIEPISMSIKAPVDSAAFA